MPRLILVFAVRTGHFVGFVMQRFNYYYNVCRALCCCIMYCRWQVLFCINQVGIILHFHKKQKGRAQWMPVSHTLGSPYSQGTLFLEIPGVVRGEAIREAPVRVPGRPVHDGLQVLPLWPTCVRAGVPIRKSSFLLKKNLPYISVEYQYNHVFPYLS